MILAKKFAKKEFGDSKNAMEGLGRVGRVH